MKKTAKFFGGNEENINSDAPTVLAFERELALVSFIHGEMIRIISLILFSSFTILS